MKVDVKNDLCEYHCPFNDCALSEKDDCLFIY